MACCFSGRHADYLGHSNVSLKVAIPLGLSLIPDPCTGSLSVAACRLENELPGLLHSVTLRSREIVVILLAMISERGPSSRPGSFVKDTADGLGHCGSMMCMEARGSRSNSASLSVYGTRNGQMVLVLWTYFSGRTRVVSLLLSTAAFPPFASN